eukprot:Gb_30284 [translate_table: standard]
MAAANNEDKVKNGKGNPMFCKVASDNDGEDSDLDEGLDEDYIDMEVGSAMFWEAMSIQRRKLNINRAESREFEFGINAQALEEPDTIASPADELFYKGQLLPLHLPPRIQMVEKLLNSEKSSQHRLSQMGNQRNNKLCDSEQATVGIGIDGDSDEMFFDTNNFTPYESCQGTPYDSGHASQELNPDVHGNGHSQENYVHSGSIENGSKWKRRLPMLKKAKKLLESTHCKQSALALKLKASRAYLKCLFTPTKTSGEGQNDKKHIGHDQPQNLVIPKDTDVLNNSDLHADNMVSKARGYINRYMTVMKPGTGTNGSIHIQRGSYQVAAAVARSIHKENSSCLIEDVAHRKSFSGSISSIKRSTTTTTTSSSASPLTSPIHSSVLLKRSSSANSDMENAIQGAIAHCKQSHAAPQNTEISGNTAHLSSKLHRPTSNAEGYTHSNARPRPGSRLAVCDQTEKPGLCRG